MRKRRLVLIFNHFEKEHLGKDVFLVPYYLGRIFNLETRIVYPKTKTNRCFPRVERGVSLCPVFNPFLKSRYDFLKELVYVFYILFRAGNIDVLMRFHFSDMTAIIGALYKRRNKNGILYVKADADGRGWVLENYQGALTQSQNRKIKLIFISRLYSFFLSQVDCVSVETQAVYEQIGSNTLFGINMAGKAVLLPNGFDEDYLLTNGIGVYDFQRKENIILTVGRIGTWQKNTEMLLEALGVMRLEGWKACFIGPVETEERDFQACIDAFFAGNPALRDKIIFTGPIYDKRELYNWYNRAKIFVFTSRYESYGIVLAEALRFHNYIISTDTGGAPDLIKKYACGELVPQEDHDYLAGVLQKRIDGGIEKLHNSAAWKDIDISWERYIGAAFKDSPFAKWMSQ